MECSKGFLFQSTHSKRLASPEETILAAPWQRIGGCITWKISSTVNMGRRALPKINPDLDLSSHWKECASLGEDWQLDQLFERNAPLEVEVGSGKGLFLQRATACRPENNFAGIEVSQKYCRFAAARLARRERTNAIMFHGDAFAVFARNIADASLHAVHVYFPDPWWKKRHHKRRLITPDFLGVLGEKLQLNGCLYIATDWQEYAEQIVHAVDATPVLCNQAGHLAFSERPDWRPLTKYEQRGLQLGHQVFDISAKKI